VRKILIVIAAFCPLWVGSAESAGAPASIAIHATTSSVAPGEDIRLEVTMTNNSTAPLAFFHQPGPNFLDFANFLIAGPSGATLMPLPTVYGARSARGDALAPGDQTQQAVALNSMFDMTTPGAYTVQVVYHFGRNNPDIKVLSNVVAITVGK
jgi:hypothetical protein